MLSSMNDDLMCEFEEYDTAKGMWEALKRSLVPHRQLNLGDLTKSLMTIRSAQIIR